MRKINRSENDGGGKEGLRLDVRKAAASEPSFFMCPISLEVMRSPVSLCTGVTYDRSSIQRWLDSGNSTCPATMQPLPSTDLVPNLTLRRLIHIWSEGHNASSLSDLSRSLSDPATDDFHKLRLLSSPILRPSAVASLLLTNETLDPAAVTLVSLLLSLDVVDDHRKRELIDALKSDLVGAVSGLVAVLKLGVEQLSSRIAAGRVLERVLSASSEDLEVIAESPDLMIELVRLIGESDAVAVEAGLRCLIELIIGGDLLVSSPAGRKVRVEMVKSGAVAALEKLMGRDADEVPSAMVGMAMRVMEAAAECAEGRTAICAEAEKCVAAVMGRMMKIGNEGREAAVSVLWSVCCAGGGDRRAREVAAAAKGGLAKMLVVMQGDCSPAARMMAGDLLRVFRANAKSSVAATGYDSKTIHIRPY